MPTTPIRPTTLNYLAHDSSDQHISPTKAAALTRLHHDLTILTTWLESLLDPSPIPPPLLKWRDEVLAASTSSGGFEAGIIASDVHSHNTAMCSTMVDNAPASGGVGNDVLEALKALKQANLSADHLRSLIHDAEVEELRRLQEFQIQTQTQHSESHPARVLLDYLHAALPLRGSEALNSLCESAVMMGLNLQFRTGDDAMCVDGDVIGETSENLSTLFSRGIFKRASRNLVVQEQLRELGILQTVVGGRMASQDGEHKNRPGIDDSALHDEQAEEIHVQTAQYNRNAKQVNLKIMEYEDRIRGLERQVARLRGESAGLREVLEARRRVEERRARVAALEQRVAAFHGLPPDLEASRSEVRRAMDELAALMKQREGLFVRIGNG